MGLRIGGLPGVEDLVTFAWCLVEATLVNSPKARVRWATTWLTVKAQAGTGEASRKPLVSLVPFASQFRLGQTVGSPLR